MAEIRPRLKNIAERLGTALLATSTKRERKPFKGDALALVLKLADGDPTVNQSRTQWLAQTYCREGGFRLEDLGRAHKALTAFERMQPSLAVEHRQLERMKTLTELEDIVEPFVQAEQKAKREREKIIVTGQAKKRQDRTKAHKESVILQGGDNLPSYSVPITQFAAKWLGRGTRWCTAADKDNAFRAYNMEGPLVVIMMPDGRKFQAHACLPGAYEGPCLKDDTDKNVPKNIIEAEWDSFRPLLLWMCSLDNKALNIVPKALRDYNLCLITLQSAISESDKAFSMELCRARLSDLQRIIPIEHMQGEILDLFLKFGLPRLTSYCNLPDLDEDRYDVDMIELVTRHPMLLRKIRPASDHHYDCSIADNPKVVSDDLYIQLCQAALPQNGGAISTVPPEFLTPALCHAAIEHCPLALAEIPKEMVDRTSCEIAVSREGRTFQYVPAQYKDTNMMHLAIAQHGGAIIYTPLWMITKQIIEDAVKTYPDLPTSISLLLQKYHFSEIANKIKKTCPELLTRRGIKKWDIGLLQSFNQIQRQEELLINANIENVEAIGCHI
jgi:hypothetical protein